jgi:hypothetical protein
MLVTIIDQRIATKHFFLPWTWQQMLLQLHWLSCQIPLVDHVLASPEIRRFRMMVLRPGLLPSFRLSWEPPNND